MAAFSVLNGLKFSKFHFASIQRAQTQPQLSWEIFIGTIGLLDG
jgi:hypothetical protein